MPLQHLSQNRTAASLRIHEPTVVTSGTLNTEMFYVPLSMLVAKKRLFVMNAKGEMEPVVLMSYWSLDDLLTVSDGGAEWDENGDETRRWVGTPIDTKNYTPLEEL